MATAAAAARVPTGVAIPDRVRYIDVATTLLELAAGRTPPAGSLSGDREVCAELRFLGYVD